MNSRDLVNADGRHCHAIIDNTLTYAHTLSGTITVALPSGLLLLLVLLIIRRPLWFLLPQPHRQAWSPVALDPFQLRPSSTLRVIASVAIGVWSHVLWDGFTHRTGWFVQNLPWLQHPFLGESELLWYTLLQHLSTVVGLAVIVGIYSRWIRQQSQQRFNGDLPPSAPGPEHPLDKDGWRYGILASLPVLCALGAITIATSYPIRATGYQFAAVFLFRSAVFGTMLLVPALVMVGIAGLWLKKQTKG
jgi:hypothetical protein